jgi:hypothetical protein
VPTHVCQNKKCVANNGRPAESGGYFDFGLRGEFCSEECMSEAIGVPTRAEREFQEALFSELLVYRLREDADQITADAWVSHLLGIVGSRLVRNSGRAAGQRNELPEWPEKPHAEAPAEAKRLHMYREVVRITVRDFARYEYDASRRAECEARKIALALDFDGLRSADKAAQEALQWDWRAGDPIRDLEYACEMAELRWRREERARRQRPRRDPRLTGEQALYPV